MTLIFVPFSQVHDPTSLEAKLLCSAWINNMNVNCMMKTNM